MKIFNKNFLLALTCTLAIAPTVHAMKGILLAKKQIITGINRLKINEDSIKLWEPKSPLEKLAKAVWNLDEKEIEKILQNINPVDINKEFYSPPITLSQDRRAYSILPFLSVKLTIKALTPLLSNNKDISIKSVQTQLKKVVKNPRVKNIIDMLVNKGAIFYTTPQTTASAAADEKGFLDILISAGFAILPSIVQPLEDLSQSFNALEKQMKKSK